MVVALAGATAAAILFAPTSASAAPQNCSTGYYNGQYNTPVGGWSGCTHGSGLHRVVIRCQANTYTYLVYGAWKPAGQLSTAWCGAGHTAISKSVQVTG
jgi:hypothetical protein